MLCILYVTVITACLGAVAQLIERALPITASRRWLWCAVIAISVAIPGYYRNHHTWAVPGTGVEPAATAYVTNESAASGLVARAWTAAEVVNPLIRPVWYAMSAAILLWGAANLARVWWIVRRSRLTHGSNGRPEKLDEVPVFVTESVGPATVGIIRPSVLVPRWVLALPRAQRKYVLRHEDEHRRSHDARLLFVASMLIALVPWNISLWWVVRRLRLAVEMDCDIRVVSALGDPAAYGELLFKVAQAASRGPRLQPAFLGGGMLERRLRLLLAPTPLRKAQRVLVPLVAFVLLLAVLSMPHPVPSASHAHDVSFTQR
jgi:beta-lactamase regulating signal transducer with metallopeptidase domain